MGKNVGFLLYFKTLKFNLILKFLASITFDMTGNDFSQALTNFYPRFRVSKRKYHVRLKLFLASYCTYFMYVSYLYPIEKKGTILVLLFVY